MNAAVRSSILVGSTLETSKLSDLHAMLLNVERADNATRINEIVNHPAVVCGFTGQTGQVDCSLKVMAPENHWFVGDGGVAVFSYTIDRIYRAGIAVLPKYRGKWARLFAAACVHKMFAETPAVEIYASCPASNPSTRRLAVDLGWTYELTAEDAVPAHVFRIDILDWILVAPGLAERGRWFMEKMQKEYARHGSTGFDPTVDDRHARHIGAFCELLFAGRGATAVAIYNNRFVHFSGYYPIEVMETDPVIVLRLRDAVLIVKERDFYIHSLAVDPKG